MENENHKKRGQVSIMATAIMAGATILASVLGSWGLSNAKVQVIEERENNHYQEVKEQLDRIEKKFDDFILIK